MTQKLLIFLLLSFMNISGQRLSDTIFVYDLTTQSVVHIPPVAYDTSGTSGNTSSSLGSLGNKAVLPVSPPAANLAPGTVFTELIPAQKKFNVSDYPIRVAVSILAYQGDTVYSTCGGTMVGKDFVLSAAFCGINIGNKELVDSMVVLPAYDNGACAPPMSRVSVSKIYSCGRIFSKIGGNVLLQLKSSAGNIAGWAGIAYNQNNSFYTDKVLHKFSHPTGVNPFDSTEVFNGDTMYYDYGKVQGFEDWILVSGSKPGIPGQGGSSFLYTDNNECYAMGSLAYSTGYIHTRIDQKTFYVFKHIMESSTTGIAEGRPLITSAGPNPFSDQIKITLSSINNSDAISVQLFDLSGQAVQPDYEVNGNNVVIYRRQVEAGLYILKVSDDGQSHYLKVIIQ